MLVIIIIIIIIIITIIIIIKIIIDINIIMIIIIFYQQISSDFFSLHWCCIDSKINGLRDACISSFSDHSCLIAEATSRRWESDFKRRPFTFRS